LEEISLEPGETKVINLEEHFKYIIGEPDSVVVDDTISYILLNNSAPEVAEINLVDSILTLEASLDAGSTEFEIMASAGFTKNYRTVTVAVQSINQINMNSTGPGIKICPNPIQNELTIAFNNSQQGITDIELLDLNGMIIISDQINIDSADKYTIDLCYYPAGIYLLRIKNKGPFRDGKYGLKKIILIQ
jgi:hypothetical protein